MDIYHITNTVDGKRYIGLTSKTYHERCHHHFNKLKGNRHQNQHLQAAVNKYGIESFVTGSIEEGLTEEELSLKEIQYIAHFNTTNKQNGYNLTYGGEGMRATEETRKKISVAQKGKSRPAFTPEHKANMSAAKRGIVFSDETKARISAAKIGKARPTFTPAHKANMSAATKGRVFSDETKTKMSTARKQYWANKKLQTKQETDQ